VSSSHVESGLSCNADSIRCSSITDLTQTTTLCEAGLLILWFWVSGERASPATGVLDHRSNEEASHPGVPCGAPVG
jgi:hypothetical protein